MKQHLLMPIAIAMLLANGPASAADTTKVSDQLQAWIARNAVAVRSVDAADEEFSDLAPLAKAIGSAQVVELGEPGHGAGTSFAAKVRLIKFLHQKMGFDVLVWESGMYDVALSDAGMRGGDDPVAAARRGVFQLWSDSEEVRPLFQYVKASQTTGHPLNMAGFDMQVTADGSMTRFASDLRSFVQALKEPSRSDTTALADQALAARTRLFATKFANEADLASLDNAARQILVGLRSTAVRKAHDSKEIAWMQHWIENMRHDARFRYESAHASVPSVERENFRDAQNFENLRWLIQEAYQGRKFIIWAHNVHVMKAGYSSDFRAVHVEAQPDDMKTTGARLTEWLGNRVYSIGMTTYQGKDALVTGGAATTIAPAAEDSLEGHLHALGQPFIFLDLRAADPALPIRNSIAARMPKYESNTIADPGCIYDGIFYIDRMEAATRLN